MYSFYDYQVTLTRLGNSNLDLAITWMIYILQILLDDFLIFGSSLTGTSGFDGNVTSAQFFSHGIDVKRISILLKNLLDGSSGSMRSSAIAIPPAASDFLFLGVHDEWTIHFFFKLLYYSLQFARVVSKIFNPSCWNSKFNQSWKLCNWTGLPT